MHAVAASDGRWLQRPGEASRFRPHSRRFGATMDGPTTHLTQNPPPVADAPAGNWVDRYAPAAWRPYLRLARLDRPIGTWLLLFPCWWSLALAEVSRLRPYPDLWYLVLFAVGALVMRGAGCA